MQRAVAGADRAHQHVGAAAGVFGQRLHHDVGAQAGMRARRRLEAVEGQARAPGVVQRRDDAARPAGGQRAEQVGELQRDGAGGFQPHQPGVVAQLGHRQRVVEAVRHAPLRQPRLGQVAVLAVDVVRHQHLVARAQDGQRRQRDGGQAAGHQQAVLSMLQRRQARGQRVAGGRAVQAVAVGQAVARARLVQVGRVLEQHGGRLGHRHRHRIPALGGAVGVVDERGAGGLLAHQTRLPTRSCPSAATIRTRAKSPTFMVLLAFSGGRIFTVPSISGASA